MGYIRAELTEPMRSTAQRKADYVGEQKGTIRGLKGNYVGFLGQAAILTAIPQAIAVSPYNAHVRIGNSVFETHSKERKVYPRPDFEASITLQELRRKLPTDFFLFVSMLKNYSTAWITGHIPKREYIEKGVRLKRGDYDASNGYTVKKDCINLAYAELNDPEQLRGGITQTTLGQTIRED